MPHTNQESWEEELYKDFSEPDILETGEVVQRLNRIVLTEHLVSFIKEHIKKAKEEEYKKGYRDAMLESILKLKKESIKKLNESLDDILKANQ
jgi:hypothetical protein